MQLGRPTLVLRALGVVLVCFGMTGTGFASEGYADHAGKYQISRSCPSHRRHSEIFIRFGNIVVDTVSRGYCAPSRRYNYRSGYYRTTWVGPIYSTRYDACGRPYRVLIRPGYWNKVWIPATVYPPQVYPYRSRSSRCRTNIY